MPSTIAVIIPTHNRSHYLIEALESVYTQSRLADEVIVVDDGSTDDTPAICSRFTGLTYIKIESKSGLSNARNVGVSHSSSDIIAFLDDDDTFYPGALKLHLQAFQSHSGLGVSYARTSRMTSNGRHLGEDLVHFRPPADVFAALTEENFIRVQASAVSKAAFLRSGGFNESIWLCEDIDFWMRLSRAGESFHFTSELATRVRKHSSAMSFSGLKMSEAIASVVRQNTAGCDGAFALRANSQYRLGRAHLDLGNRKLARASLLEALSARPGRLRYWAFLFLTLIPSNIANSLRSALQRLKAMIQYPLVRVGVIERRWGPPADSAAEVPTL